MPLTAVCSADPSHVIKVDEWEGNVAYEIKVNRWVMNIPVVYEANAISFCPTCGAPIKVIEEEK